MTLMPDHVDSTPSGCAATHANTDTRTGAQADCAHASNLPTSCTVSHFPTPRQPNPGNCGSSCDAPILAQQTGIRQIRQHKYVSTSDSFFDPALEGDQQTSMRPSRLSAGDEPFCAHDQNPNRFPNVPRCFSYQSQSKRGNSLL